MLRGKDRSYLKSLANNLDPLVQIGKFGLSESLFDQLDKSLEDHELVKIKVLKNSPVEAKEIVQEILEKTGADFVQQIGSKLTIYRQSRLNLENKMEKIGILGGTFNPIHYGHLMISEYLRDELNLDKVIYVPTGYSPHKINSISADIRYKMVEIAIKNNENFQISDVEAKSGEISYSVNTVKKLKENHPGEYFFLIGSDTIFQLKTWRKLEELSKEVHFVAALRPEYLERDKIDEEIKFLKKNFNTQITIINGPLYQVSSTELRDRMKTKKSVRYLIPDEVIRFIRENNLYRDE